MSQGWSVNATADTITFNVAPAAGTNNIVVKEYATAAINATAVWRLSAWHGAYGFPKEVEFFADRLGFAATTAQPQTMWMSRIGDYSMFGKSTPITDDDAITATLNARQLNEIVDLLPKQHLLALTTGGVWKVGGGEDDPLTPSTFAARPQPSSGASALVQSLDVGETAVYYTAKGGQVRDLSFAFEADGYAGSDLTAFASHLVENRALVDWAWQAVPFSAVFAARDDGVLLTMTYKREHQVVAWGRQITDGLVEAVCTVPSADGYDVYVTVARTIAGVTKRFVERLAQPAGDDWREHVGLDCSLTFDGRGQTTAITLTGGATADDLVTITAAAGVFAAGDVGDRLVVGYDDAIDGVLPYAVRISEVVSSTVARGVGNQPRDVSSASSWAWARDTLASLSHMEGRTVTAAADGIHAGEYTITGGTITLTEPGVLVHVGLPFSAEFESLDLTLVGGQPINSRAKLVRRVGVLARDTRLLEVGPSFANMETRQPRDSGVMGVPPDLLNGWETFNVNGSWGDAPRVCVRCTDPYGAMILAIEPEMEVGR